MPRIEGGLLTAFDEAVYTGQQGRHAMCGPSSFEQKGVSVHRGLCAALESYPGWNVPNPLDVEICNGEANNEVLRDILRHPADRHAGRSVGRFDPTRDPGAKQLVGRFDRARASGRANADAYPAPGDRVSGAVEDVWHSTVDALGKRRERHQPPISAPVLVTPAKARITLDAAVFALFFSKCPTRGHPPGALPFRLLEMSKPVSAV